MLIAGGFVAALVAALAGASGFGFGLLATPLLLLTGFSLPFAVTVNLLISLATRLSVAYRFRAALDRRRVALLVGGSVPGLYLGAHTLSVVDERAVRVAAGALVMASAALLALPLAPPRPRRWTAAVAGFLGGFLGTTTSLNGIPPVLLLARERVAQSTFFADLALYSVGSASIGVGLLAASGALSHRAVYPAFVLWLPGVLAGNFVGTNVGLRVPARPFRVLVLALAFAAGALTAATA